MRGGSLCRGRLTVGLAAAALFSMIMLAALPARAQMDAGMGEPSPPPASAAKADAAASAWWWQRQYLALYKTMSYTAVVLTTDQLWYMTTAAAAASTGGWFGVANIVTSPMLTYGFEYGWQLCCEAPPGPDGVRPVDVRKALLYRTLSASRTLGLALLFGNGFGSSLLVTGLITVTRTAAYITNDYVWNRIARQKPPTQWPTFLGPPDVQ